jgi:hypothetical protein
LCVEKLLSLQQSFFSVLGSVQNINSLEVVVPILDSSGRQEVFLVGFADDVLNDGLQLVVELADLEELLEPCLERSIVIDSLDLGSSVGDDLAETGGGRLLAHEGTHALLELLEDLLGLFEPALEDRERAKHEILLGEYFVHLVGDILAEHLDQLVDSLRVVTLLGVVELLDVRKNGHQDVAQLVDALGSHQLLELDLLEETIDVCGLLGHLLQASNN